MTDDKNIANWDEKKVRKELERVLELSRALIERLKNG